MSKLMEKVDVPEGESGDWKIERFVISEEEAVFGRIRAAVNGRGGIVAGTYTRLTRGRTIVMSDTPDEMRDHYAPVVNAKGRVLIVGLGIGMVLDACLSKEGVEHVTVVEMSPDVIKLSGPHYQEKYGDRLTIIEANIFEWKPPKGEKWDVAWFDIWDDLCEDNLPEMTKLKRKFGRRAAWKGCWSEREVRRRRDRERLHHRHVVGQARAMFGEEATNAALKRMGGA
jgi:hypothetical protein